MIKIAPIFHILGVLISMLAVAMMVPAIVDLAVGNPDWQVFVASSTVTLFIGVAVVLTTRGQATSSLTLRQAFLLTTLSWAVIGLFAALPFAFADLDLSFTDAVFESVSGITTTGSTVIVGLDFVPPGILMWRALLQWLGGIGIIIMALAVMPMLSVGGMQLFKTEAFDAPDKVVPRATELASNIGIVYVGLTVIWAFALYFVGMSGFDAVAHAMTSIATGGYSTKDGSIGHFDSATIDYLIIGGMLVGSLPFVHYLKAVRGDLRPLWYDSQVRWFFWIVVSVVALMALWQMYALDRGILDALRYAAFNCISVMTGTGYATADYGAWGGFAMATMFALSFVGGCAGSTTCGIKIFRFQVLHATARAQIERLLAPHGVFIPYYNGKPIPESVSEAVMGFFFLYALCFVFLAMILSALGLDFVTATSGAATAISNVGPGLGDVIGPSGTFAPLPDAAKWALCAGMLLGRLELFTILVLILPSFWRN